MLQHDSDRGRLLLEPSRLAELVVDVWRIQRRARDPSTPPPVRVACEIALERAEALGFQVRDMIGEPYHENLRVTVVHAEGGKSNPCISDCLSPAVYFGEDLIRRAEIVIRGDE